MGRGWSYSPAATIGNGLHIAEGHTGPRHTEPTTQQSYEAYACRYGSVAARTASDVFYQFRVYAEPEKLYGLNLYFWVLRNANRTVLVDCGWNKQRAGGRGYQLDTDPLDLLPNIGVRPADVDHLVLSHLHFDHVGNMSAFTNATFSVSRVEYEYWTGPYADRPVAARFVDAEDVESARRLLASERVRLVEESEVLFPGIRVTRVGGHTPGLMITEAMSSAGRVILASDAIHLYDEIELDRPHMDFCDLTEMYRGYETLRGLSAEPAATLVAGHDPADVERFRAIDGNWLDLTEPRTGASS